MKKSYLSEKIPYKSEKNKVFLRKFKKEKNTSFLYFKANKDYKKRQQQQQHNNNFFLYTKKV